MYAVTRVLDLATGQSNWTAWFVTTQQEQDTYDLYLVGMEAQGYMVETLETEVA